MAGWFDPARWNLALWTVAVAAVLLLARRAARGGRRPQVRRIPGLEAMAEAVGRATELGRPVFFVPGVRDLDNVQTVAGLAVFEHAAALTARHACELLVPTDRSLVLAAAREIGRDAYTAAGRADGWRDDRVVYVSDDQFGFAARVDGLIARERPAACFYFGFFAAESLLIAEAGQQAGAIQVAGTAERSQLPFLVAACDYTLIGEELFAASAALRDDPEQLGVLRGQDLIKAGVIGALLLGAALSTAAAWGGEPWRGLRAALLRLFAAGG